LKRNLIITVDGPAGAGKSTVGRLLAEALSCTYLDTGSLYRGIAYQIARAGVRYDDLDRISELCRNTRLELKWHNGKGRLYVNGRDVSKDIRTPEISMLSSRISAIPFVRQHLLGLQRTVALNDTIVAEGRDMGTVVFPDADIKFFLDASVEERTERRYRELTGRGVAADREEVKREIIQRDRQDTERETAPLRAAEDAVIIDSTNEAAVDVVGRMLRYIREKFSDALE